MIVKKVMAVMIVLMVLPSCLLLAYVDQIKLFFWSHNGIMIMMMTISCHLNY